MKSPKKIIGSLGRKYGGRPFQIFRKFVYDTLELPSQAQSIISIAKKEYKANTTDNEFYNKFYKDGHSEQVKSGVVFICDGSYMHGGVTDRLKGILTTYKEAKRKNLPFYIHWTSPFPLEEYLIPAKIDWRINDSDVSNLKGDCFPIIIEERIQYQAHLNNTLRLKMALYKGLPQTHVYSNADNARGTYKSLFYELFKPSPYLEREVKKHLSILGDEYYAFSFRFIGLLGQFTDCPGIVLPLDDAEILIDKVITEFKQLAKDIPYDKRILITSDSIVFLNRIAGTDDRIYIVPGDVKHLDFDLTDNDIHLKIFVDQHLLMNAKKITLIRTNRMYKSDFPRFAAEIGNVEFIDHIF